MGFNMIYMNMFSQIQNTTIFFIGSDQKQKAHFFFLHVIDVKLSFPPAIFFYWNQSIILSRNIRMFPTWKNTWAQTKRPVEFESFIEFCMSVRFFLLHRRIDVETIFTYPLAITVHGSCFESIRHTNNLWLNRITTVYNFSCNK